MSAIKRCVDCKFYQKTMQEYGVSKCGRTNRVGEPNMGNACEWERAHKVLWLLEWTCGAHGRFWEPPND